MDTEECTHPGTWIPDVIEYISKVTQKTLTVEELADGLKISTEDLSAIIDGKQDVTAELSFKFGRAFNLPYEFWIRHQVNYNMEQARKKINLKEIRVFFEVGSGSKS